MIDGERIFEARDINRGRLEEELSEALPALRCIQPAREGYIALHFNNPGDAPTMDEFLQIEIWPPSRNPTGEEAKIVQRIIANHDPARLTEEQQKQREVEEALDRLRTDKENPRAMAERFSDLVVALDGKGIL